jgi:hypothetical protein
MASAPVEYTLGKDQMPNVERAVHLGIIRTTCVLDNIKENVDENMKKAIRSAYALFGCSLYFYEPTVTVHALCSYLSFCQLFFDTCFILTTHIPKPWGKRSRPRNNDASLQNLYNTSSTVWHGSTNTKRKIPRTTK